MNKNRFKAIFLSVAVALFAFSTFLAPLAEAIQDPGPQVATKYLEVPLTFTREDPTMIKADGCERVINLGGGRSIDCVDVASGIGVYNYVGSHTPDRSNFSAVVAIDDKTGDVLNPAFGLVSGGKLRIYDLTVGHTYKIYVIFDDKNSADIKKLLGQVAEFCKPGSDGVITPDLETAYALKKGLVDACSRYNAEPFLPAALNPAWLNGQQPIVYSKAIMSLTPLSLTAAVPTNTTRAGGTGDDCPIDTADDFRWLACPAYKAGRTAAEGMDRAIQNFLFTPTDQIFTPQMKTAWSSFRTIGVILILLAGLVMVISQALGFDLFDAYTVKKLLPRLLVAAIGITLSWPILYFVISFFNDIGGWTHDLILAPFSSMDTFYTGGSTAVILGILVSVAIKGGVIALGAGGLISLLGTMLLALLIGMIVLALRQAVILMAVLMAPLAIAAYILPGTQKLWEFWKSALLTSLYMFPIIMGFIAAGKALAFVLGSMPGATTMHLLAVMVYFAPYFLLPFAFKLAGGLMATVFSIANDRSRGIFDSRREKRKAIRDDRLKRAGTNQLWDVNSRIGRKANTAAGWAVDPGGNLAYSQRHNNIPLLSKKGRIFEAAIDAQRNEQSKKWLEHVNQEGANDKFYAAVGGMYDGFDNATKAKLITQGFATGTFATNADGSAAVDDKGNRVVSSITAKRAISSEADHYKMADILEGSGDSGYKAALALRSTAAYTANMYRDAEMGRADTAVGAALGRAYHGFLSPQDSADSENLMTATIGASAAHAATVNAQAAGSKSNPDNKPGYGTEWNDKQKKWVSSHKGSRAWSVLSTVSAPDYAQAKGNVLKDDRMGRIFQEVIDINGGKAEAVKARWRKEGVGEDEIAQRITTARESEESVRDTLFSLAGPYSGQSPDGKSKALRMIRGSRHQAAFEAYSRSEMSGDPNAHGSGAPPPAAGGQPGGGLGGGGLGGGGLGG